MQSSSIQHLSLEIIGEIISRLDYPDQENAYYSCRAFYHARRFVLFPAIKSQSSWLKRCQNSSEIPGGELVSHNAFLRILNRTFTVLRPESELNLLVSFFAQELISAWMIPTNERGAALRWNKSVHDTRLYHERYPLLQRLAMLLRWNGVGSRIALIVNEWLDIKWTEIKDETQVEELMNLDFDSPPSNVELQPHQTQILYGLEFLALHPITYFSPQDPAAEDLCSPLNDEAWAHPAFDRLKLWLSVPELWNLEIRHIELKRLLHPYRVVRRINRRPFLQLVLFQCAQFGGFSLRLLNFIRFIELSTPHLELIQGARYWYEEGYCASALWWNFYIFSCPGQYISLFKKPFVDLIRGYIQLFGTYTLSDLILNIVFIVHKNSFPMRRIIGNTVMSELSGYEYEFLSVEAKAAILRLMTDETGNCGWITHKK